MGDAMLLGQLPATNLLDIDETDLGEEVLAEQTAMSPVSTSANTVNKSEIYASPVHNANKIFGGVNGAVSSQMVPTTPVLVNNQLAFKFAQLERTLEITKAQNNNLLEQQVSVLFFSSFFL